MRARLEATVERQRRFTADVSHEFRAPLSVITAEADLAACGMESIEEYRKASQTILREALLIERITENLLILTRADAGYADMVFDHYKTLEQLPDEDGGSAAFDELIGVNVRGYLLGAKAALEPVRAAKGTMIFTASISGLHPNYGGIMYIPAKHAVVGLTKRLALELAPDVRVNAVAPGFMPTPLAGTGAHAQGSKDPTMLPPADSFLMKRVPTVANYAPLYTFLASRDSIQLVGQILNADHGLTLQRT